MKKIGHDELFLPTEDKFTNTKIEATKKPISYFLRVQQSPQVPKALLRNSKKNDPVKKSTQSEFSTDRLENALACHFDQISSGKIAESEVITFIWESIRFSLKLKQNMQPQYRNVILLQTCNQDEILRMGKIATEFLMKMQAFVSHDNTVVNGKTNMSNTRYRFRVDFSCLMMEESGVFALCPEKGSDNAMVRKNYHQYTKHHISSYAHFIEKLPKWKTISLMPDPDSFFGNIVNECESHHRKKTSYFKKTGPQVIFIFYVYRADNKELITVLSFTDIQHSIFQSSGDLMRCIHSMQKNFRDPYTSLRLSSCLPEHLSSEKRSLIKKKGIITMVGDILTMKKWKADLEDESYPIFHFLSWYLTPVPESATIVVSNVSRSPDLYMEGNMVHVDPGETKSTQTKTISCLREHQKKKTLVKYVPIDFEPNIQYRIGNNRKCKRVQESMHRKNRSLYKNHCISETIQRQSRRKSHVLFQKTSISLLVQNLNITKQSARQIIQFLHQIDKYFSKESPSSNATRALQTQMMLSEPHFSTSTLPSRIKAETKDLSHQMNDMKVHINYLTRKLEEHELRESIVSEKEAAIDQWELRRETLNHSVEELVSLLNTNDQRKGSSLRKGRLSNRAHVGEGFQHRLSWESNGPLDIGSPVVFDDDIHAVNDYENSSEAIFNYEESSQQSTPVSFCDTYAHSKIMLPSDSYIDRKTKTFYTPRAYMNTTNMSEYGSASDAIIHKSEQVLDKGDRYKDSDYLQILDENRFLRSKVDILNAYTSQLEVQFSNSKECAHAFSTEQTIAISNNSSKARETEKRMHGSIRSQENIPCYMANGLKQLHNYTKFLMRSCRRVVKMSDVLQKTIKEKFLSELESQREIENRSIRQVSESLKEQLPIRRQKSEGTCNKGQNTEPSKIPTDQNVMRSLREQIKNLLLKLSSKDKENTQWRNKVQKLTRELQMSISKETNLRNQLDTIVQRNQLLTKDFNMFKKNLRKVDRETEKIQNQNQILKNQLEKIEKHRTDVSYRPSKWSQRDYPSANLQKFQSRRMELTISKVDSLNNSRYNSDEQSNSTFGSILTLDEQSFCSMTISQTSTVRTLNLTVPKLSLDRIQGIKHVEIL